MKVLLSGDGRIHVELARLAKDAGHELVSFSVRDIGSDRDLLEQIKSDSVGADLAIVFNIWLPDAGMASLSLMFQEVLLEKPLLACALTSSTTGLAIHAAYPERVVGWGALPPIAGEDGSGLVEVARGLQTEDWAFKAAFDFWQSLGLEPVEVADSPGLVRARVACCLINEAVSALADGVASPEDIDAALQLGNNFPKGPLAWADELGLDLVLAVLEGIHQETGDPAYRPHPLLKRKVWANQIGKEVGHGFFQY